MAKNTATVPEKDCAKCNSSLVPDLCKFQNQLWSIGIALTVFCVTGMVFDIAYDGNFSLHNYQFLIHQNVCFDRFPETAPYYLTCIFHLHINDHRIRGLPDHIK